MKKTKKIISNIVFLLKPYWKYGKFYFITSLIMSTVFSPALTISGVLFTQTVVDAVSVGNSFTDILAIILKYFVLILAISAIKSGFNLLYREKKIVEIQQKIKLDIYLNAIKTDYKYFDNPKFYDNYTWAINEYIAKSNGAYMLVSSTVQAVSIVITMGALILVLGTWLIVITILEMICSAFIQVHTDRCNINKRESITPLDRKLDYVHRIFYQREYASDIKSTKIKDLLFEIYSVNAKQKINIIKKYAKTLYIWIGVQNIIGIVYNAAVLTYISYGIVVSKRIVGIGKFTSLLAANTQFMNSLNSIFKLITEANNLSMYADKINDFFHTESYIENQDAGIISIPQSPFSIKVSNLNFSYENSSFAIKDISLQAKPGDKIAIVGANGSGKTTLFKLLLRLYDPTSGNIYYNGISAKEYNVRMLRDRIGVAFQSTNIYATSLAQNLQIYGKVSESKMNRIIDEIGLSEILKKFNGDINSELTKEFNRNGIMLSSGECQKLGIARIMAQNFGLILLDEPSATLDPVAEYELSQILFNEANKTTAIIVSHRLSMVRKANYIYVMSSGSIVEKGTHDELMELKGVYYNMFTKQSETYKD